MAVRPVLRLPNKILNQRALSITDIDDGCRALATDLVDTMRASPACVGIAAPQIGAALRAFVVDVTGHRKAKSCHGEILLFNPEVVSSGAHVSAREGCMSVPDFTGDVSRASELTIRGITVKGNEQLLEVDAFEARAILHEIDHLDGMLFIDRVASHDAVFRRQMYK